MNRSLRALLPVLLLAPLLGAHGAAAAPAAASDQITDVRFTVQTATGTNTMVGTLYCHGTCTGKPVQVLLHGGNYQRNYWDAQVPDVAHEYSYARWTIHQAGHPWAVLALDLLGAGESSHPNGDALTLDEVSEGVHQVLTQIEQEGNPTGTRFDHIALIGHSLGALVAIRTQSQWHQADVLVTTGMTQVPHALPFTPDLLAQLFYAPYYIFPPFLRQGLGFYPPTADPAVVAYDGSALVSDASRLYTLTAFGVLFQPTLNGAATVTGPVLVQLGQYDPIGPAAGASQEAAAWPAATVTVQTLADTGHLYNLHTTNIAGWEQMRDWLNAHRN